MLFKKETFLHFYHFKFAPNMTIHVGKCASLVRIGMTRGQTSASLDKKGNMADEQRAKILERQR